MSGWHNLINKIPETLLSPEQKNDAKAAIALKIRQPLEPVCLFDRGHTSAASHIRGLISLLPGV